MIKLENVLRRVARIAEGLIVMLGDVRNVGHQNIEGVSEIRTAG